MKLRLEIRILAFSLVFGLTSGLISTVLPYQYKAKGLLIITRKVDEPSKSFFTYEGSYAQQNAGFYVTTFISLLQSPSNLKSADDKTDVEKLGRLIKVKKEGAQSISLVSKGETPQEALVLWNSVTDSAIKTHNALKSSADPYITVSKTPNSPVILNTYPSWQKVFGMGFVATLVLTSSFVIIDRYLKGEYDS